MKTMQLVALCALVGAAAAISPTTITAVEPMEPVVEYEAGTPAFGFAFELSWQNFDNVLAAAVGTPVAPEDCASKDGAAVDCFSATIIFGAEYEYEPVATEPVVEEVLEEASVEPLPEVITVVRAQEYEVSEATQFCRGVIEAVDAACQAAICSDDCRAAAQAAVNARSVCAGQPLGLAYSSCGVHSQTFDHEVEIVARMHDCECLGMCPSDEVEGISNPYCQDDAAYMQDLASHRITRCMIFLTFVMYFLLWMSVHRRYVRCVEQRYAAAGRPLSGCQRVAFRIIALPLTACITQFVLCMIMMMPSVIFLVFLVFVIVARRRARAAAMQRAVAAARAAQRDPVMMVELGEPTVCIKAEENQGEVVVGELVDEDGDEEVVVAVPQEDDADLVVGEVVAEDDKQEIVVADVVA